MEQVKSNETFSSSLDLTEQSIQDIINHHAEVSPQAPFLIDPNSKKNINFKELRLQVAAISHHISTFGIAKGETVGYALGNSTQTAIAILGIMYGGYLATAVNLVAGNKTIQHILEHSACNLILVDEKNQAMIEEVTENIDHPIQFLKVDHKNMDESFIKDDQEKILKEKFNEGVSPDTAGLLMYTSGTTGLPKGVVLSHANLLSGGNNTKIAHQLSGNDRAMCTLPLYHINGLCVTLFAPLVSAGSVVIPSRFSVSDFWETIESMKCSWFSVVPTQISYLLHDADKRKESCTPPENLKFGRSASAPLAPETQMAFEKKFQIPIIETMGLTETAAQILSNPLPPGKRKIGSPGIAFGNEVMIVDENQAQVTKGTEGEVVVRGPNVMQRYYKNKKATNEIFNADGWLRTGDLGKMDEEGYVFITGRLKELIIKGGENIAPREIDDVLYSHPDVIEAAAFARPCKNYGQAIEAGVALKEGASVSEADLIELCKNKVGAFKSPDRIHFLSELPKGASGKIQRIKLAKMVLEETPAQ